MLLDLNNLSMVIVLSAEGPNVKKSSLLCTNTTSFISILQTGLILATAGLKISLLKYFQNDKPVPMT